jgi:hypothetical protein
MATPGFLGSDRVYCGDCSAEVNLVTDKFRLRGKMANLYECTKCVTRKTLLRRSFGSWPTKEFERLQPAEKQAFYASVSEKSGGDLTEFAEEYLRKFETKEEYYAEGGEFLPLEAWVVKGFCKEKILANTLDKDKRPCRVMGDTYRVPIYSAGTRGTKGHAWEDGIKANANGKRGRNPARSSSSSSSSSTSSKRHKKKRKELQGQASQGL